MPCSTGDILEVEEWGRARGTAQQLWALAHQRLNEVSSKLAAQIKGKNIAFGANQAGGPLDKIAQRLLQTLDHQVTSPDVSTRVDLKLNAGQGTKLTILFYAIGPRFRGIIGVLAYFIGPQNKEPGAHTTALLDLARTHDR